MARDANDKPNVIIFFTDQQRWDSMALHGNPLDLTPNLDRTAITGTHLAVACTPQPVCGPARACLQTGLYATRLGCHRNAIELPATARTLAHHFRDGGYTTGYIGKWHLGHTDDDFGVPVQRRGGYEYWLGANVLEFCSEPYNTIMYDNDNKPVLLPGYRVDAETDAAIRYIDAHQREPFYLMVSYLEPHFQNHIDDYPPPDGYRERYTGRWTPPDLAGLDSLGGSAAQHLGGYWGICKRLDEAFGRMLDALKSLRLLDNTIVAFTSDHGCHFKTRNSEYKRSCHESSIRIPMVLRGPGFDGGGHVARPVSLLDLPPTLLDAAGLPVPNDIDGRSFLPLVRDKKADWPEEVFVQISEAQVGRAIRTGRWKYGVDAPGKDPRKDSGSDRYVEQYLYDLATDPYELRNLAGFKSHRPVADICRDRLVRRMVEAGEKAPVIEPAPEIKSGQRRLLAGEELM